MAKEIGKAVLFTLTADGKTYTDVYTESADCPDPVKRCEMMRSAVGNDFPGAIFSIGMNDRARDLMATYRMRAMGFDNYTHGENN